MHDNVILTWHTLRRPPTLPTLCVCYFLLDPMPSPFCPGPVYKLAFGPRSFIVVSDPVMAKHVLKSSVGAYDKGVLATVRGYA